MWSEDAVSELNEKVIQSLTLPDNLICCQPFLVFVLN